MLRLVRIPEPERRAREYPHQLSGGMRQRAMIAMALALDPKLLIADEPTTALDVTTQAQILKLVRELQGRKKTGVLFITHDFGVVSEIADRVVVMQLGRIVEQGAAEEVLRNPREAYTRMLLASANSVTRRSMPSAIPPCGGAPNLKASRRKPNFSWDSSSLRPMTAKTRSWMSRRWIRIEPPPISLPLQTMS